MIKSRPISRLYILCFYIVFILFFTPTALYSQNKIQAIYRAIENGETENAISEINNLENTFGDKLDDESLFYISYFKGIINLQMGKNLPAMEYFKKACEVAEKIGYVDLEYLDALLHIMRLLYDSQNFSGVIETGKKALLLSEELINNYPLSPYIYSSLISALTYETQFTEIDSLYEKGLQLRDLHFSSSQEEYYELPVTAIVAFIIMGQHSKAEAIYNELIYTYQNSGCSIESLETGLINLKEVLNSFDKYLCLEQRKEMIETIGDRILMANPSTSEGALLWRRYFDLIRETLEFFYFDVASSRDEDYWNSFLSQMIVRFYVCGDYLQDRERIAYNNVLLKNNFLNYHSGKAHKRPYSWQQVSSMLDSNEVAIEITQLPDEILILKHNAESPLAVPIDSLLVENLLNQSANNYQDIRILYSHTGNLSRLWSHIEPHLNGITRVYLSSSNVFNRFNYGAIPLDDGLVSDKYQLIRLLSTADIKRYKENRFDHYDKLNQAILYGGIRYDVDQETMLSESKMYFNIEHGEEWSMTRGLDENSRGKFEYISGTLDEVIGINEILTSSNISTSIFSGARANEESFKSLSGSRLNILHIATHGFMLANLFTSNASKAYKEVLGNKYQTILSQSGLALAGANSTWQGDIISQTTQDGILTSKEISELDLSKVELVVLSACNTGLGDDTNLTGLSYGVLHAFKMAGANKILASIWPIDDYATSVFMHEFYEQLINNDCGTALKLTQKKLQDTGFENPYYWAGFILIE